MEKKQTILYVDDEEMNLLVFEANFVGKFNIITAKSGFEGIKIIENKPDIPIVISDMKMPEMNGIEFIKTANKQFPNIVYFILTGFEMTDEISLAIDDKLINDYFKKPFNRQKIETSIKAALNNT